ncbi:NmrA family protein [Kribbella flavida DSM 17836]|uniref:NmrA family protein n=1 Tax=Kribbella flavida (strain DSM 17836 / JCM 10339 / NBRC 14399) TaxID=479435 RepID=D2PNP7_KRIFD|nr:NAD(P)H-binding protein [Kribbella flavida]ADB30899.1 NmrA family protein [Kribbella flavida DSM 17836]
MAEFLVTGSSGQVGRPAAAALRARGADVLGLSRRGGPGAVAADLLTGQGVDEALKSCGTVLHLAAGNNKRDLRLIGNLTAAAKRAGVGHVVLISIVGCDRIPLGFYRDRATIEQLALASGVPVTIQRTTQFHSLIDQLFSVQKFLPVVLGPRWRFQPIAVEEVVTRLVELAVGAPQGRADDIGGPAQHSMRELHAAWKQATRSRRPGLIVRPPGKLSAAYDAGPNLVPGPAYGQRTFEQYLREKYR